MRIPRIAWLAVAFVLVAGLYAYSRLLVDGQEAFGSETHAPPAAAPIPIPFTVDYDKTKSWLDHGYGASPDARLLRAVTLVATGGRDGAPARAQSLAGGWIVDSNGLSFNWPRFIPAAEVMEQLVQRVPAAPGGACAELDIDPLLLTDLAFGLAERPEVDLCQQARVAAWLVLATPDRLGVADAGAAQALYLLARRTKIHGPDPEAATALLLGLGYHRSAEERSAALDQDHPLRLAAQRDWSRLRRLSRPGKPSSHAAAWLYLRMHPGLDPREARRVRLEAFEGVTLHPDLLHISPEKGAHVRYKNTARALPVLVSLHLATHLDPKLGNDDDFGDVLRRFGAAFVSMGDAPADMELGPAVMTAHALLGTAAKDLPATYGELRAQLQKRADGQPLLQVLAGHYDDLWSGAHWARSLYLVDVLNSVPAAEKHAQRLIASGEPITEAVGKVTRDVVHLLKRQVETGSLVAHPDAIEGYPPLGGEATFRIYNEATKDRIPFDLALPRMTKALFEHIDERPSLRPDAYFALNRHLLDYVRSHRWGEAILAEDVDRSEIHRAHLFKSDGNVRGMKALLRSPIQVLDDRGYTVKQAVDMDAFSEGEILSAADRIRRAAPARWDAVSQYTRWLGEYGRYREAAEIIERWRKTHGKEADGFTRGAALTVEARHRVRAGDLDEAERLLKPFMGTLDKVKADPAEALEILDGYLARETQYAGALHSLMLLALARGEVDRALEYAESRARRYPQMPAHVSTLEALLEFGQYARAGAFVSEHGAAIEDNWWGPFDTLVKHTDEASWRRAIDALAPHMDHRQLFVAANYIARQGHSRRALYAAEKATSVHPLVFGQVLALRARMMRALGRGAEAERMLAALNAGQTTAVALAAYEEHDLDTLWSLSLATVPKASTRDSLWAYRAALGAPPGDSSASNALGEYYAQGPNDTPYRVLGAYALGQASREQLAALVDGPSRATEVAHLLGTLAERDGRHEEANDWLRVTMELALPREGEYRWAELRLSHWVARTPTAPAH